MMLERSKPFDPNALFETLLIEIESTLQDANAKIARLAWLREKLGQEYKKAQDALEDLETFTECEAGQLFKLNEDPQKAERAMADLRRKFNFPFCRFGREIRYTKPQLIEICGLLEINGKARTKNQMKRAA
jgi:hypothetical protein